MGKMENEVLCPICLSILYKPVTLPCDHIFCHDCINEAVSQTAYQCPICRFRLSNWLRKVKDLKSAINLQQEDSIRKMFPVFYEEKDLGKSPKLTMAEQRCLEDITNKNRVCAKVSASPGAIQSEYQQELAKFSNERALQEKMNEEASLALAFQLLAEDDLCNTEPPTNISPIKVSVASNSALTSNIQSRLSSKKQSFSDRKAKPRRTLLDYAVDCQTSETFFGEVLDEAQITKDEEFARKLQAKYDGLASKPSCTLERSKRSALRQKR